MELPPDRPTAQLLVRQEGVATWHDLAERLGPWAVRRRVETHLWQRPVRGVIVAHNGPLTPAQELWVDVLTSGQGAVLAGLTAAGAAGFAGFADSAGRRWVLVPHGQKGGTCRAGLIVKSSTSLGPDAVLDGASPPRTRTPRSLVDAAVWARSDRHAHSILLAGVQQRLVRPAALAAELARRRHNQRRGDAIAAAIADAVGGAQTLPEAEVGRICRRHALPLPARQTRRNDTHGRARWLDCEWPEHGLVMEIDGRGHFELRQWWADMLRDAFLVVSGVRVLRLPSFIVREEPELVAELIRQALELGGWRAAA